MHFLSDFSTGLMLVDRSVEMLGSYFITPFKKRTWNPGKTANLQKPVY
jgi:hypothetical protein